MRDEEWRTLQEKAVKGFLDESVHGHLARFEAIMGVSASGWLVGSKVTSHLLPPSSLPLAETGLCRSPMRTCTRGSGWTGWSSCDPAS